MKLGKLIKILEREDPKNGIRYDFCGFVPAGLASYRGYYDQLALGYEKFPLDSEPPTAGEVLSLLRAAVGETFTGYKGGEYTMDEHTEVWVSNYGEAWSTKITGVEEEYDIIILNTKRCDQ